MQNASCDRILEKIDLYFLRKEFDAAERHLLYWLESAKDTRNMRIEMLVRNELMGLYRKLGKKDEALQAADAALKSVKALHLEEQVGAATTYLNAATVYKAFSLSDQAIPLFENAKRIYERELSPDDRRMGGLYNNMALALVDVGAFRQARECYEMALSVMLKDENGAAEAAITYLNLANLAEAEKGLEEGEEEIGDYLDRAEELLDAHPARDGYYAFVCEKCASVFDYYGRFVYVQELERRQAACSERKTDA